MQPERVPTQAELLEAATELGIELKPNGAIPPRVYRKLVDVVRESWREIAKEVADDEAVGRSAKEASAFSTSMAQHMTELQERGISESSAALIAAAIAPTVWRDTKGAAHS
jgi:hypothetical protein